MGTMDRRRAMRTQGDVSKRVSRLLGLTLAMAWPSVAVTADDVPPRPQADVARGGSEAEVKGAMQPAPTSTPTPTPTLRAQDAQPLPRAARAQPELTQPAAAGPQLHIDQRSLAMLRTSTPAPLEAGVISRAELRAELARGVARFLRQVRTQPVFERGRFVGWRLLTLFPERPDIHVKLLRAGDLVQRINGRSLERPEQFQAVWESLAQADELVIELRRDTQPTKLRFAITP
jgi:hypothetical protein